MWVLQAQDSQAERRCAARRAKERRQTYGGVVLWALLRSGCSLDSIEMVGPGGSYYFFCFRFSGALLFATETARRAMVPAATAAFVVPLWF